MKVKEGKAGIWVEKESGLPVIGPVGKRASEGKVVENKQVVMNITMRNWTLLGQCNQSRFQIYYLIIF